MKKILALALVASFVLGAVSISSAAELKTKGEFAFSFHWFDNTNFKDIEHDSESEDDFHARQRVRLYFDYVANENLKGQVALEIGESVWGQPGKGADYGADDKVVEVKRAFIQFNAPGTALQFKVGVQGWGIPSYVAGNQVLDSEDAPGIAASYKFSDMVALTALWLRAYDDGSSASFDNDEADVFGAVLPISMDGVAFTPYALYAYAGEQTGFSGATSLVGDPAAIDENIGVFWFGAGLEVSMFDPFIFAIDGVYGSGDAGDDAADREGYYIAGKLGYKMDMVYPQLVGWYTSGEDDDAGNGSEVMPFLTPYFYGTTFGFDGYSTLSGGDIVSSNAMGTGGLALILADISFVEDMSHDLYVAYVVGTHDENAAAVGGGYQTLLTEEDSAWEVDFNTSYKLYENLSALLELGMVTPDLDRDDDTETAWKASFGLKYKF